MFLGTTVEKHWSNVSNKSFAEGGGKSIRIAPLPRTLRIKGTKKVTFAKVFFIFSSILEISSLGYK